MEMHQIRYFLAAARASSFTRAAETCHVSQPALTVAMKRLEAELGAPLFFREANKIQLTEFGRQMSPLFEQIYERTEAAATAAENFRLVKQPPVRVGVIPTLGPVRIAGFLSAFEQSHPGIEVAVSEGRLTELTEGLETDRLDAAILNPMDGLGDSFRTESLYAERYVVILPPSHALRESDALSLQDLSQQSYVDRLACEMREMVMRACGQLGITLYARFRSEREDWVQAMVAANLGFAFMPEYSVTHPGTNQRPLVEPAVQRTIALASMRGRPHAPAVDSFMRAARAHRWLG